MFDLLFEYYNLTFNASSANKDTRPGAGITLSPDPALGTTSGDERSMGDIYSKFDDNEMDYDDTEDEATLRAISKKINTTTHSKAKDRKRHTVGNTSGNMRFAGVVNEKSDHTTTVTQGISPRLTYRGAQKGPSFGTQSSATYIRNRPGRKSGTQYGTSRAPIDYDSENMMYFGEKATDPMERSFNKQQIKMIKMKRMIKRLQKNKKKLN